MHSHALCRLVVPSSRVAHNPVCALAILRRRTLICRLRNMFEEVLEILDRPRTIACALALDRTRPTNLTRSLDKDRPINVYAREVMESVKPFDNHHIRRTNVDFTSACVRFETPLWHTRRAPRGGADRFQGLRQTNLDWVRAMLHESYGMLRGGLVAFTVRIAIATVIVTGLFLIGARALGNLRVIDATSGEPATSETSSFSTVHQGLSGFSGDWLTLPFERQTVLPIASAIVVAVFTALAWNLVGRSSSLRLPISRRRFATVRWLRTQIEDVALAGGMLMGLLALGAILSRLSEHDPWTNLREFVSLTIAAFVLLPFIYWMRLWWVDARVGSPMGLGMGSGMRPSLRDDRTDSADPWTLLGYAIATVATVGGGKLLTVGWTELSMHLRAALPTALEAWIPLVVIVPIALVRWLWLVELQRFYARGEMA